MKAKSDLGVRTVSAVVMIVGTILIFTVGRELAQGVPLLVFLGVAFALLMREAWGLAKKIVANAYLQVGLMLLAATYFGWAISVLLFLLDFMGNAWLLVIAGVAATDIGAYFFGRAIGGPKIAPSISPSKTWAGLAGGVFGASFVLAIYYITSIDTSDPNASMSGALIRSFGLGLLLATVAQAGDFFESWLKRKAGVKDSGRLIPGHGGIFDRTDGLIAVLNVLGLILFSPASVIL